MTLSVIYYAMLADLSEKILHLYCQFHWLIISLLTLCQYIMACNSRT